MSSSPQPETEITEAFLITKEFQTSGEFSDHIQKEAIRRDIRHLEMLLEYCEEHDVDPVAAAGLIDASLKVLLQAEAERLHLLKPAKKKA